jgi:hypothetical protein
VSHGWRASNRSTLLAWGLCLAALVLSGCQSARIAATSDAPAVDYKEVELTYNVSGQYREIPLELGAVQPASSQSKTLERWSAARLSIQYPHPEGKADLARATLRLSGHVSKPASSPRSGHAPTGATLSELPDLFGSESGDEFALPSARDDEIWVLDFPKQQLDLLMADLRRNGFFDSQTRPDPGTRLEVSLEGHRTAKAWTPEPRLDDFVARVHGEGRLSGFAAHSTASRDVAAR